MSIGKAEHISAANYNTQLRWKKHQVKDYLMKKVTLLSSMIIILQFIYLKIQFCIQDSNKLKLNIILFENIQKGILNVKFVDTNPQWANIFTKPLAEVKFNFIKKEFKYSLYQRLNFLKIDTRK